MVGKLLIFEGPDGVGKTTIVQELKAKLSVENFKFLSFPGREEGTLGNAIYRMHHSPQEFGIKVMSELARQTLHIAAHIDVIETRIKPWIAEGKNVVLDRFWWSTLVYGSVGGGEQQAEGTRRGRSDCLGHNQASGRICDRSRSTDRPN